MGEKAYVVCEVQVLQLLREGPLDLRPLACCGLPHDPVDHHQEDRRREQTALTDAGLYTERFRQFPVVDHLTGGVFARLLDDGNELWWKAVVVHQYPDNISVDTIECFLKVDKDCVQRGLPLQGLLDDNAHGCNVVRARAILSETCLFDLESLVQGGLQPL